MAVFAKPTVPGQCKTRLAAEIGDDAAASLAAAFLNDTWTAVASLSWARPVLATTEPNHPTLALYSPQWDQGLGDLGARQERVLRKAIEQAGCAIAVGADSPGIPLDRLERAREALKQGSAAVVPSNDGGYVLLALPRCPQGTFDSLPWSDPGTLAALTIRLNRLGMRVAELEPWFDVDTVEDLRVLRNGIGTGCIDAGTTAAALARAPSLR